MNPYVILIIQIFFSSGTYIIANAATQSIPAANLTFIRILISGSIYLLYLRYSKLEFRYKGRDLALLLLLGFLSVPVNQFSFLYGVRYTTATSAAILYSTSPVIVLLLSGIYLKERITLPKIIGTILAFAGVLVIVLDKGPRIGISDMKGDFFVSIAVLAWSHYIVLGRKVILKYGALNSTIFAALAGSAMFLPIGLWSSVGYSYSSISGSLWLEVIYLSIITSIVGYILWYSALSKIEASKVAVFANGQPVVTAILGYIFLKQGISLAFTVGAVTTIAGVLITQLRQKSKVQGATS